MIPRDYVALVCLWVVLLVHTYIHAWLPASPSLSMMNYVYTNSGSNLKDITQWHRSWVPSFDSPGNFRKRYLELWGESGLNTVHPCQWENKSAPFTLSWYSGSGAWTSHYTLTERLVTTPSLFLLTQRGKLNNESVTRTKTQIFFLFLFHTRPKRTGAWEWNEI